jgi:hypothetical protein
MSVEYLTACQLDKQIPAWREIYRDTTSPDGSPVAEPSSSPSARR